MRKWKGKKKRTKQINKGDKERKKREIRGNEKKKGKIRRDMLDETHLVL